MRLAGVPVRREPLVGLALAALVAGVLLWLAVFFLPPRLVDEPKLSARHRVAAEGQARATLVQALGGLALLGGLIFTGRTFLLERRKHVTERLNQAVEHLSDPRADVRLGGIFALERVARDGDDEHGSVLDILSAFLRRPRPVTADAGFPTDVQAAASVVSRLAAGRELDLRGADLRDVDLAGADLRRADLTAAQLAGADLTGALLELAILEGAHLEGANLRDAVLDGAVLDHAHLAGALLLGASLEPHGIKHTSLVGASLPGARLQSAKLRGASLVGAELSGALFNYAKLEGCSLAFADAYGADFSGVSADEGTTWPFSLSGATFDPELRERLNRDGPRLLDPPTLPANPTWSVKALPGLRTGQGDGASDEERHKLDGADLANADLRGADLSMSKLDGTDLSDANLQGATLGPDLTGTVLAGADLRGARLFGSFERVVLDRASMQGVDLTGGAVFRAVDLRDSALDGAKLARADLRGAELAARDRERARRAYARSAEGDIEPSERPDGASAAPAPHDQQA